MKREKILNVLIFILIFIAILPLILKKEINNLDEIWNYNFGRNISNGLVPYKDFNMVITPLLPLISGMILKITLNELIIMRILATILCSTILYITYRILGILNIKKEVNIIFIFIVFFLFYNIFGIDYNYATLLLVLFIVYKEIKTYKEDNVFLKNDYKTDFILGILAGLTVTIKQTTGLFICISLLGNKILFVRTKEEFKIYIKCLYFRLGGILIPIILMLIYLICNNAFEEFISYTIKGISGFSNYIPYTKLIKFNILGILSILVPITFIYEWIKTVFIEKDKIAYILLTYGLAMFVVCFPISDNIHFFIGALPTIILIFYELYNLAKNITIKLLKKSDLVFIIKVLIIASCIMYLGIASFSFYKIYNYFTNTKFSILKSYKYIPINKKLERQIINVDTYINSSNKDIKILDASAAVYMIPLNRYNKAYDMLNKGNLGHNGEEKIIKNIQESKNTQYLILKDYYILNWQTPLSIINYVKENKTKVGEIEIFDIYE